MTEINTYSFGNMKVDGKQARNDVKIIQGRVNDDWWRKEGHNCAPEDVKDILQAGPEVLVIGTGANGVMRVDPRLKDELDKRGIELIAQKTGEAYQTFNKLEKEGRDVAGAFHLTC
ncbi:Mth938-like domain-containing protein [Desulfohalovibrio reitneri]|uniref:Mth938-like domain-containing protein n=1 Tax=Desulfohalovibrio reitneri TaxID=1307759 RepID=UPI0004A75585|nr:MTH938/NDUFAF3 family protein [Desulfohalovibrio reitneri]